MNRHVVTFSGGVGSWAAAKRVVQRHGAEAVTLLFTDTLMEDEDLYRFLAEAVPNVGARLVHLTEGRTPWEVFRDERFLGNSKVDPCSKILKRQMKDVWIDANCDPSDTVIYVGIDWTEIERYDREPGTRSPRDKGGLKQRRAASGWRYEAPMCQAPYLNKAQMLAWLRDEGIRPPRLYELGFAHNNCGGFCIKAGHGHFALLLRRMPDRYAYHEAQEQAIRTELGDVSILTDRSGDGRKKVFTLRQLRERIQGGQQPDLFEIGGCGCMIDDEDEAA